jgi:hypothetical protein
VTFGHLFGADPSTMSPHGLLNSIPRLWPRYFGTGAAEVIGTGDDRVVLRVTDWSAAPAAAELIVGFLERIAELTGVAVAEVDTACEDASQVFTVEWSDELADA